MLFPKSNAHRDIVDCSGVWDFRPDPEGLGLKDGWGDGFESTHECAVPGSWNEQLQEFDLMNYVGGAWYQREVHIPHHFDGKQVFLRVGSADFESKLWVNGQLIAENDLLCLPYDGALDGYITPGEKARIVIWVNNEQRYQSITPGVAIDDYIREQRIRDEQFPATRPDFFPYGGIQRPVLLCAIPRVHIADVTLDTHIDGSIGLLTVRAQVNAPDGGQLKVAVSDGQVETLPIVEGNAVAQFRIEDCRFWSLRDPYLYDVSLELEVDGTTVDSYALHAGVREITVRGRRLYLNGEKVFLRGFGKHEDFPVHGRGLNLPLMVKDFGLMHWIGANSFRTSHYPYAEEILDYADRKGVLVISELASVNLDFRIADEETLRNHRRTLERQIARDKNHPSVIMWSVANEPGYLGEEEYQGEASHHYWKNLCDYTRELDASRPVTVANVGRISTNDPSFHYVDIVSINRYYGWYDMPGQLDRAAVRLQKELDDIAAEHDKPILVLEFGADTIAGAHSTTDQLFTEEYQARFLETYCDVIENHPNAIGTHVWNFADFRTAQNHRRVILNLKGVFTRTREPKLAAFRLKERWSVPFVFGSEA
ncbi:beta-glucuronidase [Microbulbifer elongatus]|uniref:beta-glucuronidase n=1 Tax=Microbulbifer elongatus TaxID=86173 RepID=UPI001CFED6D8|nr:beta-glucuronidase [Microbulbifer elongatus]